MTDLNLSFRQNRQNNNLEIILERRKVRIFVVLAILLTLFDCYPKEEKIPYKTQLRFFAAYYPPHHFGYGSKEGFAPIESGYIESLSHKENDPGWEVGKGWGSGEIKGQMSFSAKVPFLQKEGLLFSNNSLELKMINELSPIHYETVFSLDWTLISFFYLTIEQRIGTGWKFLSFNGLGRNSPGADKTSPKYESFSGIVSTQSFAGTFQFDLGSLIKSDFSHFVISATAKFRKRTYTLADDETAWQYQNDWGENFNGWQFTGTYFAGYLMPFSKFFNIAGIHVETEQHITHKNRSIMKDGWGSDFVMVRFGPLLKIELSDSFSLTTIIHFIKDKAWSDETIGNRYFEFRKYSGYYVAFDRIVFVIQYNL